MVHYNTENLLCILQTVSSPDAGWISGSAQANSWKALNFSSAVIVPIESPIRQLRLIELPITSHVMISSERLPPPPLTFVGATVGTGGQKTPGLQQPPLLGVSSTPRIKLSSQLLSHAATQPFNMCNKGCILLQCILSEPKSCLHIFRFLRLKPQMYLIHEYPVQKIN